MHSRIKESTEKKSGTLTACIKSKPEQKMNEKYKYETNTLAAFSLTLKKKFF